VGIPSPAFGAPPRPSCLGGCVRVRRNSQGWCGLSCGNAKPTTTSGKTPLFSTPLHEWGRQESEHVHARDTAYDTRRSRAPLIASKDAPSGGQRSVGGTRSGLAVLLGHVARQRSKRYVSAARCRRSHTDRQGSSGTTRATSSSRSTPAPLHRCAVARSGFSDRRVEYVRLVGADNGGVPLVAHMESVEGVGEPVVRSGLPSRTRRISNNLAALRGLVYTSACTRRTPRGLYVRRPAGPLTRRQCGGVETPCGGRPHDAL
jgi:hypothetical protein